jgi:hypothetical protein
VPSRPHGMRQRVSRHHVIQLGLAVGDTSAAAHAVLNVNGFDTVDAGTLGTGGRRFQFGTRAFVAPYGMLSNERGTPAPVAAIRAALGV